MAQYIKRHDVFARLNHWVFAICGIILGLGGALLFFPAFGNLAPDLVKYEPLVHRVMGAIFVVVPLISWIIRPSNFVHTFKNLFAKWDADDKEFMKKFALYLFNPKKIHMPKQQFVKSGQRISDLLMYAMVFAFMITGVLMWIGTPAIPEVVFAASKFIHDVCFFGWSCLMVIHIYLGAGIFQPYRGIGRVMFGDGYVLREDAEYHWGHWADKEVALGENIKEM